MSKISDNISLYGNLNNFGKLPRDQEFSRYCTKLQVLQQDISLNFVRDNIGEYWLIQVKLDQSTARVFKIPDFVAGITQPVQVITNSTGYRWRFDSQNWKKEDCVDEFQDVSPFIQFYNPKKTFTIVGPNKPLMGKVAYLFSQFQAKELKFKQFDIQEIGELDSMFEFQRIGILDLSGIKFGKVQSISRMFEHAYIDRTVDLSMIDLQECKTFKYCFSYTSGITNVIFPETKITEPVILDRMFSNCNQLKSVNIEDLHISNVFQSSEVFNRCNRKYRFK